MAPPLAAQAPRVSIVTAVLPPESANVTGTPAHVRKTFRAVAQAGAEATLLEIDTQRLHAPDRLYGALAHAWRTLRATRPDVLHAHGHIVAAAVLPVARALGIPLLLELHGRYVPSRRGVAGARPWLSGLAGRLELPVVRQADHVVAQAIAMRDRLIAGGARPERVTVLYPGLWTAEFTDYRGPPAEVPGARQDERVLLYVGSTHAYQGLDLFAAAQRRLPPGFRVVLLLSSDAGPPSGVLEQFGFDPATTTIVTPSGPSAIPAWCLRADVLVHARPDLPDNANVQSKLGLYLASGRPLAVTDVGDYPALLGGSAGCVLARPDAEAFAAALVEAARPERRHAAARQNPPLARRYFEAGENALTLVNLYRALSRRGA